MTHSDPASTGDEPVGRKPKVAITVDPEVKAFVEQMVASGQADSASAVFGAAMHEYMHTQRRRRTLITARAAQADPARVARMMAHVESQRDR
ncbi:hypothetical protein [Sinosporangium siamense]|uniref:Uncharacterized protein n=1 Tax=Sinosporangium siamense TaxID=1367973 RepID=A0A919RIA2_9ACTN|nr:hypothetical protein [Sinosporangium siamense]GII94386.1 hypothetical protein Ssi02_46170 [Sinosporangium siamense]